MATQTGIDETKAARCTGHCCRRFALEHSYEHLQAELQAEREMKVRSKIPDLETIATMVIPLAADEKNEEYVYTCKHLSSEGDCTIYKTRPQMCRDFPTAEEGCHFRECTSSDSAYFGANWWQRLWRRYRWLRKLNDKASSSQV